MPLPVSGTGQDKVHAELAECKAKLAATEAELKKNKEELGLQNNTIVFLQCELNCAGTSYLYAMNSLFTVAAMIRCEVNSIRANSKQEQLSAVLERFNTIAAKTDQAREEIIKYSNE